MTNIYAEEGLTILNSLVPENNPYAFEIGTDGNPVYPIIILARRNGDKINRIENVTEVKQIFDSESVFELSFVVSEYADGKRCEE